MRFYIIAGEASGDLHASNLIKAMRDQNDGLVFRGWGGDLMEQQGVEIVKHYRDLAFMGFIEVVANLRTILGNIEFCKKDILDWKPDALILVDYPGFNLRIAEFAKEQGIKVIYYISPQIWAWKQSRVHKIKKVVDLMLVILPFEKEFYKKFNYEVTFVGHPLLDAIESDKTSSPSSENEWKKQNGLDQKPVIALVPGSRKQEIATMLPLMAQVCDSFPDYQFVVAAASSVPLSFYRSLDVSGDIKFIPNQFYAILKNAEAALVTSGTATLETALFGVPEIVCYKGSIISYHIARRLIKVKYISLVNLIMDRVVVQELIQQDLNRENLVLELNKLLNDKQHIEKLKEDYRELKIILGYAGASKAAAGAIFKLMAAAKI
jgi:lipid-A-disaccharide synthase